MEFQFFLDLIFFFFFKKLLSHFQVFATLWTVAHQVPLSMGFPRQECWSGLPFPPPGDLPDPGIKPRSPALAGGFSAAEPPGRLSCSPPRPHLNALELSLSLKYTSRFFPTCGLPSVQGGNLEAKADGAGR